MKGGGALDLVVLVPGADERATIETLLQRRSESLGIRQPRFNVLKHPRRDPGCYREAPAVLQPYVAIAGHALVLLDREGSGREDLSRERIQEDLESRLAAAGWEERARVIVVDPELEAWVWSDSPHVETTLGWQGPEKTAREWLTRRGDWLPDNPKPHRPKECLRAVLRRTNRRTSSALFGKLAEAVGLERCADPAFAALRHQLRIWFPTGARA